jgi:2-polyprenyl-6-methoxyphenol hydroxylase-like FAD-dependent oxidoreductase
MKAIVIGAGPGGLTAAIALRAAGWDVAVFDRAEALDPVGAGLALYHNAVRALGTLGLVDAVTAAGVPIERAELRTWRGELLTAGDLGRLSSQMGVPAVGLHRADLQGVLLDALGSSAIGSEAVHCGFAATAFTQTANTVVVRFANGHEEVGDILVGADGLMSAIRAQLLGDQPPRYAGYTCWRGIATIEPAGVPPRGGFESWGRGARFGMMRVAGGRVYWFAVVNAPEGQGDSTAGRKRDVLVRFSGWHAPVESTIETTAEHAILRHDIYDRDPVTRWGEGRMTLLGDAAHPMTPNLAQGAGQAIEDGVALARCLGNGSDVVGALRRYERMRQARTAPLVIRSRRMGQVAQLANPLACLLRDRLVKLTPRRVTERQLEAIVAGPSS